MPEAAKFALYFLIGGTIVSLSSYIGAQGRGFLAAFVSTFPAITGVTILLIYLNGGMLPAFVYAKHLLWLVPPWLIYVGVLILTIPRFNFWLALGGALGLYMCAVAMVKLTLSS
jgi:hypothetical protein